MREPVLSSAFRKDLKRELRSGVDIADILLVIAALMVDKPLPEKNRDHALTGNYKGFRECHIKPDLLLVYQKPDDETLVLARLGSHSELFR